MLVSVKNAARALRGLVFVCIFMLLVLFSTEKRLGGKTSCCGLKRIKQSEGYVYFPAGELPEDIDSSYLRPGPKLPPKTYRELPRYQQ